MKTQSLHAIRGLIRSEVRLITNQVKETLAFGYPKVNQEKVFSPADLWNIQKRGRTMISRRRFV